MQALMTALAQGRVNSQMLEAQTLGDLFKEARDKAAESGYELMITAPMDIEQCTASYVLTDSGFTVFIHVPLTHADQKMQMHRLHTVPFQVTANVYLDIQAEEQIIADRKSVV